MGSLGLLFCSERSYSSKSQQTPPQPACPYRSEQEATLHNTAHQCQRVRTVHEEKLHLMIYIDVQYIHIHDIHVCQTPPCRKTENNEVTSSLET